MSSHDPTQHKPPLHLRKAMNLMRKLYAVDPNMQIGEIMVFLHVALNQNEEITITTGDFIAVFGMTTSTASRNSYYWALTLRNCSPVLPLKLNQTGPTNDQHKRIHNLKLSDKHPRLNFHRFRDLRARAPY